MSCHTFRSTSLTAVTLALAASTLASAGTEHHFGLSHTTLGGATLSPAPDGTLLISNIGSSGQDGVSIDLGHTTGVAIRLDPGESGSLAPGEMVCVTSTSTGGSLPHASLLEDGAGGANLVLDSLGVLTPQCIHVQLRLRDDVVEEKEFPASAIGQVLVSGPFGSDEFGQPITLELSSTSTSHTIELFNPAPVLASITGSPVGPVVCDEVAVSLNGLPPGEPYINTLRLYLSDVGIPSVTVTGEYMRIRPKGWDGTIKGHLRTTGDAQMTGVAGPDICAGCPECCLPGGSALALHNGATISNIGSSGQDGVRFACRPWGSPWFVSDVELRTSGVEITDDDSLALDAVGTFSGSPGHDLGSCMLRGDLLSGQTELLADFSPVGSADLTVEVRDHGAVQGGVVLSGGAGVVLGTLTSAGGLPLKWTKCGKLGGGVGQSPCYVMCSDELFVFVGGGQAFVGNDLRVLATSAAGSIDELESVTLRCKGVDSFTITAISDPDYMDERVDFRGVVHEPLGAASLAIGDLDDDGRPDLAVANIGSSGQDGVSIDLGQADGVRLDGRWSVDPNGMSLMSFDIYDDQCPMCPAGLVAGIEFTATAPGSSSFRSRRHDGLTGHVTLIKRTGAPAGAFTMDMTDELTISNDPGTTLEVTEVAAWRGAHFLVNQGRVAMQVSLEEDPPNPADPDVTVTHPVHGSFDEVAEIRIRIDESGTPAGSIDRACVTAAATPGSMTSFMIERTGVVQHGHAVHALGESQLVSQECDDDDSTADVIWARRKCCPLLGSSGQDGVSIDLSYLDPDDDGDGWVDLDEIDEARIDLIHEQAGPKNLFRVIGATDGGPPQVLASMKFHTNSPGHKTIDAITLFAVPTTRTVTVRDQAGNVVLNATVAKGPVATQTGDDEPETYEAKFGITPIVPLVGAPTETLAFVYQKISWTYNMTLELPGHTPVVGRSLEVMVAPKKGPVGMDVDLHAIAVRPDNEPGEARMVGVLDVQVGPIDPPCPADLDGSGNVGFGDLTQLLIGWGACPKAPAACPRDLDGSGNVGFGDLTQLLINWGPCEVN